MNKTHIYIIVAVLALGLIVGVYFYFKPSQGQTGQTGQISLAQIKEKTIAGIVEFREYVIMVIEKTLNDPTSGMSDTNRIIWKDNLPNNKNLVSNGNKQIVGGINALTNKDEIYNTVTFVVNEMRTIFITPLVSELSDKNIGIDLNKKADDLLITLKF